MSDEYLRIPTCPRCQRPHRYRLVVERSPNGNGAGRSGGAAPAENATSGKEAVASERATPLRDAASSTGVAAGAAAAFGIGKDSEGGAALAAAAFVDPLVESRRTVRFSRRFICPWTAEGFQVTFPLKESCHARIVDVSVIGTI